MKENTPSHTFTCKGPQKMTEYSPDAKFCSELVDWRTFPPPQKKTRLCASYSNEGLLDRSLNNLKGESIRTWCVMSFVAHEKIFCLERPNSCFTFMIKWIHSNCAGSVTLHTLLSTLKAGMWLPESEQSVRGKRGIACTHVTDRTCTKAILLLRWASASSAARTSAAAVNLSLFIAYWWPIVLVCRWESRSLMLAPMT